MSPILDASAPRTHHKDNAMQSSLQLINTAAEHLAEIGAPLLAILGALESPCSLDELGADDAAVVLDAQRIVAAWLAAGYRYLPDTHSHAQA
jgi:hypothetical protein